MGPYRHDPLLFLQILPKTQVPKPQNVEAKILDKQNRAHIRKRPKLLNLPRSPQQHNQQPMWTSQHLRRLQQHKNIKTVPLMLKRTQGNYPHLPLLILYQIFIL